MTNRFILDDKEIARTPEPVDAEVYITIDDNLYYISSVQHTLSAGRYEKVWYLAPQSSLQSEHGEIQVDDE